jgi:iron-sulfur cluster repair protein YtfE (RIC family)
MKRHAALAPISREHHTALILAQLLKRNAPPYRGLPTDDDGKVHYALQLYQEQLKAHFSKEEAMLAALQPLHASIQPLAATIIEEHKALTAQFLSLATAPDLSAQMDALGIALEAHIRKEERVLFPLLQEHCSEAQLQAITW